MSRILKRIMPSFFLGKMKSIKSNMSLNKLFKGNYTRFIKFSFGKTNNIDSYEQLEARITKVYHSIEKGFSYDEIRLGFGVDVLNELLELLELYRSKGYSTTSHCYRTALSNLNEYIKLHEERKYDVSELKKQVSSLGHEEENLGGALTIKKEETLAKTKLSFKDFSLSRHSIRNFSDVPVDIEVIKEALYIAQNTPSACNRQGWKVRIVSNPDIKSTLQKNQNGNRGFGEVVDKYILVTTDVQYFARPREFNQPYIDGGMYSMNLLYALHYVGLATVSLSASLTPKQEKNIRNALNISDSENLILFIGVGNYKDEFKIPKSDRREPKYEIV